MRLCPWKKKTPEFEITFSLHQKTHLEDRVKSDIEEEILAAEASLKVAGYFPDCISFNLDGYLEFGKAMYSKYREFVYPDKDRYSGLLIRVNYGKQEELFIVYQSWTKLDPFWPKEYLAKLAFRSLNKDI